MRLVYLNGRFLVHGVDYQWEMRAERLLFKFPLRPDDQISVVDLVRFKQSHYGKKMAQPIERILDPAQKMDGGQDERRRLGRGGGLPQLRMPEGDGEGGSGDPGEG